MENIEKLFKFKCEEYLKNPNEDLFEEILFSYWSIKDQKLLSKINNHYWKCEAQRRGFNISKIA